MSFLQTLVVAIFPVDYIHLADAGLAYLGMGVLLLSSSRLVGPSRLAVGLLFATLPSFVWNASATQLTFFLLLGLTRALYYENGANLFRSSVAAAIVLTGLITLKSNLISVSLLFLFLWEVLLALA